MITSESLGAAIQLFSYYTLQSNGLIVVLLILSLINKRLIHKMKWIDEAVSTATVWILITGIIYHFFLSAMHTPVGIGILACVLLHYMVPFGMLVYYLLFIDDRKLDISLGKRMIFWGIYPIIYTGISIVRGSISGFYPYWFLNPTKAYPLGIGSMGYLLLFIVISYIVFVGVGLVINFLQRLFHKGKLPLVELNL
jgi:hypothetical protein